MTSEPADEIATEWVCSCCGPVPDEVIQFIEDVPADDPEGPWGLHIGCGCDVTLQPVE